MARYIKANPKVAAFLHLENDRNMVKDGNYLLWQGDMLAFGPLTQLSETLEQIGGLALLAHEAREEQEGVVIRELPTATDERFIMPAASITEEAAETTTETTETAATSESTTGKSTTAEETTTNNTEKEA
jgi:hypothetical protein